MGGLLGRKGGALIAIAGAVAIFVAVNVGLRPVGGLRLDLTEDKLFTLSEGTGRLLDNLERPVTLTYYYSHLLGERAPVFGTAAARVRDLLAAFDRRAGQNVTVVEVDPEPFSETEDDAVEAGIQPIALGAGNADSVYFGLVGRMDGGNGDDAPREAAIPFFQQERAGFLEYDLAKLVAGLARPERPKIGIVTSVDFFGVGATMGRGEPAWAALDHLREGFDVAAIESPETLRDEAPDALLILHPGPLEDPMLYAIDQYLLAGGNAVIFLDQQFESAYAGQGMAPTGPVSIESGLSPILEAWGVEIAEEKIAADRRIGRVVNAGTGSDVVPAPYVGWLDIGREQLNAEDPVTAQLNQMLVPTASRITLAEGSPMTLDPLIRTTEEAALLDRESFGREPDILELLQSVTPDPSAPFVIAGRLRGSVPTAFPDGAPKDELVEPETAEGADDGAAVPSVDAAAADPTLPGAGVPHLSESAESLNVILVADADMLADRYWVQRRDFFGQPVYVPHSDNGAFLVNTLDTLAGSDYLIGLRSRGTGERPFTVIDDLERRAEAQFREEERSLRVKLEELQKNLDQAREDGSAEAAALEEVTAELLETRRRLREVNRALRAEIDDLESRFTLVNIGLMPILVILVALFASWRRRQARHA